MRVVANKALTMGKVYLFADEAGNFDFSTKGGASRYFIVGTVAMKDTKCGHDCDQPAIPFRLTNPATQRLRRHDPELRRAPPGSHGHARGPRRPLADAASSEYSSGRPMTAVSFSPGPQTEDQDCIKNPEQV